MNEAERIVQRQARTGFFGNKANRVEGQMVTHDFSENDDPTASANPSHGGIVHPEIDRLMAEHNNALGQPFGGETPQTGNRRITPKVRSGNKVTPGSGSSVLAAMSAPSAPPRGFGGRVSPYVEL